MYMTENKKKCEGSALRLWSQILSLIVHFWLLRKSCLKYKVNIVVCGQVINVVCFLMENVRIVVTLQDKILQGANKKLLELKSKCKSLKVRDLKTAADLEAVGLKKQKTFCM